MLVAVGEYDGGNGGGGGGGDVEGGRGGTCHIFCQRMLSIDAIG